MPTYSGTACARRVPGHLGRSPGATPLEEDRFERMLRQLRRYGRCFTLWNFVTNLHVAYRGGDCTEEYRSQMGQVRAILWDAYQQAFLTCLSKHGKIGVLGIILPEGELYMRSV